MESILVHIDRSLLPARAFHRPSRPNVPLGPLELKLAESLNAEIVGGRIAFEPVLCLCGGARFDLVASVDCHALRQQTVLCQRCGLVSSNPRMTDQEYQRFYSSDVYRRLYSGSDFIATSAKTLYMVETGRHILAAVNAVRTMGPNIRVLEVGAGGGWNLLAFQQSGAEVLGLDYSATLGELGREHGIPMIVGGLDVCEGLFDVIILSHVLEHFLDPRAELLRLRDHLRPGGVLYIEVPNILHFGMGQLQSAHTYYFSPRTLRNVTASCALELLTSGPARKTHQFGIFAPCQSIRTSADQADPVAYDEIRTAIRRHRWRHFARVILEKIGLLPAANFLRISAVGLSKIISIRGGKRVAHW